MEQVVTIKIQTKKEKKLCIEELQAPHPLESNNTKNNKKDEHVAGSSPPLRTQQQKIGTCSPPSSKNQKKEGTWSSPPHHNKLKTSFQNLMMKKAWEERRWKQLRGENKIGRGSRNSPYFGKILSKCNNDSNFWQKKSLFCENKSLNFTHFKFVQGVCHCVPGYKCNGPVIFAN